MWTASLSFSAAWLAITLALFGFPQFVGASSVIQRRDDCVAADPVDTLTDRLNLALNSSGPGYILSLCPSTRYLISAPVNFAFPEQEISTLGYPIPNSTVDERAILVVNGPVFNGTGHTTAITGTCSTCSGIKIRNLIINGTRGDASPTAGGGNIEIGGSNSGQLVEYVKSYDPRSWSCLHVFEGSGDCTNTTIRYNDIGPCGHDTQFEWSDGISLACKNSHVHGNWINTATDGGIVIFGAPGSLIENNTIWVETAIMIGGINMVDFNPFGGDYRGTIVRNNTIHGGFSTESPDGPSDLRGDNNETAIIKVGIAIGPRVWFGDWVGQNISTGGIVLNNAFSGALGFAIGVNSASNFTIQGNYLTGNTTFIGSQGVNCSAAEHIPNPSAAVYDVNRVTNSNLQPEFVAVPDADTLTCVSPADGNFWPFGGEPQVILPGSDQSGNGNGTSGGGGDNGGGNGNSGGGSNTGRKVGLGIGIPLGIIAVAVAAWWARRWYLAKRTPKPYTRRV